MDVEFFWFFGRRGVVVGPSFPMVLGASWRRICIPSSTLWRRGSGIFLSWSASWPRRGGVVVPLVPSNRLVIFSIDIYKI